MTSLDTSIDYGGFRASDAATDLAAHGNRRRLRVFLAVFVSVAVAGLVFTYSRPAEYRTQARIAVKTASVVADLPSNASRPVAPSVTTNTNEGIGYSLESEAGRLSSRPLIEAALKGLRDQGVDISEFGTDPVPAIQNALTVSPVSDTNLIDVTAVGRRPSDLAAIVNALVAAYSTEIVQSYSSSASSEASALQTELDSLNQRIAQKRQALEQFRERADIVSGDRAENEVLARVKGLSASLNVANDKVAQAEGKVRSLRESLAAGKAMVRSRDNPSLAGLEARASELRASLREQERVYTPQFMAMDPKIRATVSRLAELEAQIAEQKAISGKTSLAEAEDELATAQQAQRKLQTQIAEDRAAVHAFSRNFSVFESMQAELAQIEASRSSLSERLLRTETSEASRMPSVQVIEPATVPHDVWRPNYGRDAGISIMIAFMLGLLAMALVEVFNRPPRASAPSVVLSQPWISMGQPLPASIAGSPSFTPLRSQPMTARLAGALTVPRELSQAEAGRLLQALSAMDAIWAGMLLCGATPDEIRAIRASDVDAASMQVRLRGTCERVLSVPPTLLRRLVAVASGVDAHDPVAVDVPESDDELNRRLLCAAHDAGLDDPATVTSETLRHTCIAYLVRQGLRFSDLGLVVGTLPADVLARYAALAPAGVRHSIADVAPLMPALEALGQD